MVCVLNAPETVSFSPGCHSVETLLSLPKFINICPKYKHKMVANVLVQRGGGKNCGMYSFRHLNLLRIRVDSNKRECYLPLMTRYQGSAFDGNEIICLIGMYSYYTKHCWQMWRFNPYTSKWGYVSLAMDSKCHLANIVKINGMCQLDDETIVVRSEEIIKVYNV